MTRSLVVGLGSAHGADAYGWHVVEKLQQRAISNTLVRRALVPLDLLDWLDEVDELILCDALVDPDHLGAIRSWTWPTAAFSSCSAAGSHDFSLPQVLQLATTLACLPPSVVLWTLSISDEEELTTPEYVDPKVEAMVDAIVAQLENKQLQEQEDPLAE